MRSFARVLVLLFVLTPVLAAESTPMDFAHIAALRSVSAAQISPDGTRIAYTVSVPRRPGVDEDGPAWNELHVAAFSEGSSRPYVRGEVNVSNVEFTPSGRLLTYLAKRNGDEHKTVWAIPVGGGESFRVVEFESAVDGYAVSPDGTQIAFVAREPEDEKRTDAKEKGYKQEVFEEDWRTAHVWIASMPSGTPAIPDPKEASDEDDENDDSPRALPIDGSPFHVAWSPDGKSLALDIAPRPLIDDRYMHRRVTVVDATSGETRGTVDNAGKLGAFEFSPDGSHLALITAADPNDPKEGRLMVAASTGGALRDLIPEFAGHVTAFAWKDARTLTYLADVGVETEFGEVDLDGNRKIHLTSGETVSGKRVPVITRISLSTDGNRAAWVADSPTHPSELWATRVDAGRFNRLTDSNPWLAGIALSDQEVVRHTAKDGLELEGILIRPLAETTEAAPLILMVHGGPEGHRHNGWLTSYSGPAQLAAGRGFAVFFPNYRGSTGRGVEFSKHGQGDAAGKEFDDLIDAVDHLVAEGIADRDRVGITGGSYGGYATAWCATRFTERFKAGVMFVGISNKVSKGLTTEIPVEDKDVHTRFDAWTRFDFSLERSPISLVEQSRTALLIAGGTADSRVHPSQSLQLYRALKLVGKTPVRYVRYPGEGHGNRRAAARDDYSRRLMRWMEHYVTGPGGELPPVELD